MINASPSPEDASRLQDFVRYFDLTVVSTKEQRAQVFELRYHVYCEEFGYEPTELFTDHQEVDEFDRQSVHCLIIHKASGIPAGCVRVVLVEGSELMPMESHADIIDQRFIRSFSGQRNTLCEVSRLAVNGEFRRRRGEWETRYGSPLSALTSHQERRTYPLIAMFLFIAAAAVAMLLGRTNCFAIMEPFLPKILRRSGIYFQRIGEDFDFRGIRAPYHGNLDDMVEQAPEEMRGCFYAVCEEFAKLLPTATRPLEMPRALRDGTGYLKRWLNGSRSNSDLHKTSYPHDPLWEFRLYRASAQ